MANERLRAAMAAAQVSIDELAREAEVDPKTVQRWLVGRIPHARHRWAVATRLAEDESYLWPDAHRPTDLDSTAEVIAAYAHRADMPSTTWRRLLLGAKQQVDLLGYAMLFLPELHPDLPALLEGKCAESCKVRIAVADPDCAHVQERDELEQLEGTLPARIRTTLKHVRGLVPCSGVEIRCHTTHLYNAIYRFDDEMLVTPYLCGVHGFQHPLLHLRRLSATGVFMMFAAQYEAIWATTKPVQRILVNADEQD